MKYQILQMTTDGDDFSNMFNDINSLIEKHNLFKSEAAIYQFHLDMVELFGENWRTSYFHVIDNSFCDRLKYLSIIKTNILRDCDPGYEDDSILFDENIERDLIDMVKSGMPKGTFQRSCEALIGIGWEEAGKEILLEHAPELIPAFKLYCDKVIPTQKNNNTINPFKSVLELTDYLNNSTIENDINDLANNLITSLNLKLEESDYSWLILELTRRSHLLKSISSLIELDLGYISQIHHWDKILDEDIRDITVVIDSKIFALINLRSTDDINPLTKIKLEAQYLGPQTALANLKLLINKDKITDAEYYHEAVNLSVLCDEIVEAEEWIIKSQSLENIPLNIHFDFMFFYMRFDHGYRQIAQYAARILPQLSKDDRRSLVPFLLKQMEVGYLDKTDLSADVIAEILLYQNELN